MSDAVAGNLFLDVAMLIYPSTTLGAADRAPDRVPTSV